jgi:hypothetical protein
VGEEGGIVRDEEGVKTRDIERWERKLRHWGLHGNRTRRLKRGGSPRGIYQHHYEKWWQTRTMDRLLKYLRLQFDHVYRWPDKSPIERRRLVAERIEQFIANGMRY